MQRVLTLLALLPWTLFLWALPASAANGLESLDRFYGEVKAFHARFDQVVLDEDRNTVDTAQGEVWIQRPGRFRWNYDPPDAQEIVGDSRKLWIYDIELEQVTVRDQAQALGRSPAILLAGKGDYKAAYNVRDGGGKNGIDWAILRPKDEESGFTEVRIGFKGPTLEIMELQDTLGQTTRIIFREVEENSATGGRFVFVPPRGVDIINETE
ncbi:MAG: outer membrane lipoprotein chaperone LolA [Pseudomonadota bacterium]|nr:outer membrane lipoprotein chaperone LolA [Pseudomonadota bacterium]